MWRYHNPVRVTFGPGCLAELRTALAGRRYVLVTYGEPHFRRLAERVAELAGRPLAVVDEVTPNPDFATLPDACARLNGLQSKPEVLVALGGGLSIVAAPAATRVPWESISPGSGQCRGSGAASGFSRSKT